MERDDLALLLAVVRAGSASRAAAALGVSVSTVTRRLDRMEAAAGRSLVVRTAEGLTPTPTGAALLPHAEAAERAVLAARDALRSTDAAPSEPVRVALPNEMVELVLLPVLAAFTQAHPEIELVFDMRTGFADLMRREADIAIRTVRPKAGEELLATRLRPVTLGVFGRADYLAAHPSRDPADHRWVGFTRDFESMPEMAWLAAAAPHASIALRTTDGSILRHAAAAGIGLAVLPALFGELTPMLRPVHLHGPPLPTYDLWLVTHRALRKLPGVAEVWGWLSDWLRHDPAADDRAVLRAALEQAYGIDFGSEASET